MTTKTTEASGSPDPPAGAASRRKRFSPGTAEHALTGLKLDALHLVAESRFLSTAHVEVMMGWSEKTARGHLRDLYDLGLTDRLPVAGALLGTKALLSHNVHYPTARGLKALERVGMLPDGPRRRTDLRPSGYLAHELAVRDVLAWLTASARSAGHRVEKWDCSESLDAFGVRPDAAFAYRVAEPGPSDTGSVLAGLVEVDRGTERSASGRSDRWARKIDAYARLFSPEEKERMRALTGYRNAVLLVTVPDRARGNWIGKRIEGTAMDRFTLVAVHSELLSPKDKDGKRPPVPDVYAPLWEDHSGRLRPLLRR